MTMVALDAGGNPAAVPGLVVEGEEEERRRREAELRRTDRLAERDQIRGERGTGGAASSSGPTRPTVEK